MKRRLCQAPLPPPEIAFTDQQALTEQALGDVFRQFALVEFRLLNDANLLDVIGMIQEDAVLVEHRDANDVAIFAREPAQRFQRIALDLERQAEQGQAFRTGRKFVPVCRHNGVGRARPSLGG
jgi:hypothetical protein